MATYQEFKNQVLGKGFDVDGYYGNQCFDGYAYYCKWLGVPYANCTSSGYVKDIWNNRGSNGILNYFNEVTTMQSGDVAVFKVCSATPYSHIAIFDSDIDGTYGYFLGQNQGATNGVFSLCKLPYSATFDTAFRPKAFASSNTSSSTSNGLSYDDMEDETWAVRFKNDTPITIHKDSTVGANFGTFVSGETQVYQKKGAWNGHRWIGFKATVNGKEYKCVCAISGSEARGEDLWVDLIDPSSLNTNTEQPKEDTNTDTTEETKPNYTDNVKGYGVDLSEHNANVDVSKYDFVIIRCAWGENTDKLFESYVEKCEKANIPYGVYLYDYALDDSQAQAEADYCLNLIKGKNIQMGVWFDMEDADGYKKKKGILNAERCTKSCDIFCKALKEKGYYVGIYCSSSWIGNYVTTTDYPFWIANWGTNDGTIQSDQSSKAVMHQYTSNPLDLDVIYHDVDFFKSNPKSDTDESKKDDTNTPSDTDSSNTDSSTESKIDTDKANALIALLIKLVKKLLNIFK